MRGAYVLKNRVTPEGYAAVTFPLAGELYNAGKEIVVAPNDALMYCILDGWGISCRLQKDDDGDTEHDFTYKVSSFEGIMDVGSRYAVFYVKTEDLPS